MKDFKNSLDTANTEAQTTLTSVPRKENVMKNITENNGVVKIEISKDVRNYYDIKDSVAKREFGKQYLRNMMDRRSIKFQEFDIKGDGGAAKVTSYGMNEITRNFLNEVADEVIAINGSLMQSYNNKIAKQAFTDEMVKISFAENFDSKVNVAIAEEIKENGLAVQYSDDVVILWTKKIIGAKGTAMYRAIIAYGDAKARAAFGEKGMLCGTIEELSEYYKAKNATWKKYGYIYAGPSNQRQVNYLLFKKQDGEQNNDFMARMNKMFNELSGGALDTIAAIVKASGGMSREKLFKLNSRISLAFTPMTRINKAFHCFAYLNGEFAGTSNSDGEFILNGTDFAKAVGLDDQHVCGLALQMRVKTEFIAKGMAVTVPADHMQNMVCSYNNVICINYEDFHNLYIADKLEKNAVYVVSDVEGLIPTAFFDKNSLKTKGNLIHKFYLELVEVRSASAGKLNKQNAMVLTHLEGAAQMLFDMGKNHIDSKYANILDVLTKKGGDKIKSKVVNPNAYIDGLMAEYCPAYVAQDKALAESLIDNMVKGLANETSNLNMDLGYGSHYQYLHNDYLEMACGVRLLPDNVVFDPTNKEIGTLADITRNPKSEKKEHYKAVLATLDDINAALDTVEAPEWAIDFARYCYNHADDAIVVVPSDPSFAMKTGGSDKDGDGVTVCKNPEYIKIQWKEKDGIANIPSVKDSGVKVDHYDISVAEEMFFEGIFGQLKEINGKQRRVVPTSVGVMCNHNGLIHALLDHTNKYLQEILNAVVIPNINKLGYKATNNLYERRVTSDITNINNADVIKNTEDFYTSDLSVESFRNFLEDCTCMAASVIGRGIDVNKTGELVVTGYLGVLEGKNLYGDRIKGKTQKCKSIDASITPIVSLSYNENGKRIVAINITPEEKEDTIFVNSLLTTIRKKLVAYLEEKATTLYGLEVEPCSTEAYWLNNNIANSANGMDVNLVKNIRSMLLGNKNLQTEEKNNIVNALAGMLRNYVFEPEMKAAQKFFTMKKASLVNDKAGSFAHLLKEEYIAGVSYIAGEEDFATNDVCGYRAFTRHGLVVDDVTTTFNNGVSKDGDIITDKSVNGEWNVSVIDGKLYVTKTVKEYFAVPVTESNTIALLLKGYRPEQGEKKWNVLPEVNSLTNKLYIRNTAYNSEVVTLDNKAYSLQAVRQNGKLVEASRLNKAVAGKGLNVVNVYQFEDINKREQQITTIVIGDLTDDVQEFVQEAKAIKYNKDRNFDSMLAQFGFVA